MAVSIPDVGLCPKTPLNSAGILIDPPKSVPTPITEAPAPKIAPCKQKKG